MIGVRREDNHVSSFGQAVTGQITNERPPKLIHHVPVKISIATVLAASTPSPLEVRSLVVKIQGFLRDRPIRDI